MVTLKQTAHKWLKLQARTSNKHHSLQRDLGRLESWVNLVKFNKAKSKVPNLGQSHHKHKHRLGREVSESSSEEKDLGMLVNETLLHGEALKSPIL